MDDLKDSWRAYMQDAKAQRDNISFKMWQKTKALYTCKIQELLR